MHFQTLQEIRQDIGDAFIWIAVNETTDSTGRYNANVLVGKLMPDGPGTPHLLMVKQLEKTNHCTIARTINDATALLWPGQMYRERVLLMLSDGARYMTKSR